MLDLLRRKEGIQRIQIGLSGLAGVVLLVGLANIVVDNIRRDESGEEVSAEAASNMIADGAGNAMLTEPLAELGVTPAPEASAPVVADLQPDPNLREPMDRPQSASPHNTPAARPAPASAR
jgi:hypothetical protein